MKTRSILLLSMWTILAAWSAVSITAAADTVTADTVTAEASPHEVITAWIAQTPIEAGPREELATLWNEASSATPTEQLDRFAQIVGRLDSRIAQFAVLNSTDWAKVDLSGFQDPQENYPPAVLDNVRLWFARKLIQASLYDEADKQLVQITAESVLDPASFHFYRAVSAYRTLDKVRTAEAVDRLLAYDAANPGMVPDRYRTIARLMQEDLATVKEESLDHIARQMDDIQQRLALGRSGQKVQEIEDAVIRSLDKMIEKLEQQQQQQSSSSGNNTQSTKPADDSNPLGGKGEGRVTSKNIGAKNGWGNLPPKQREEAMQEVGRRFPAHYREVIEQYFRRMAE